MKKHYQYTAGLMHRLRQLGLTALLVGGAAVAAHAQALPYTPSLAANLAGTYTDLGTNGTAITTANNDDANSAAQNIGFTFNYNGTAFTQFVLNTNGYIKLGATAPAAPYFYTSEQVTTGGPLNSTTEPNLLLPFNTDLTAGATGTEYRVYTTGATGSRVCTIQWKNVADKAGTIATQYANISFQVRLYEGGNQIEFVYGTATPGVTSTATYRTVAVGLKGSDATTNQLVTVQKASTQAWTGSVAQVGDYPVQTGMNAPTAHNIRATILPDAGRTYRFTLSTPANDAGVLTVYTLGKIISPAGLPHAVSARVTNAGTAALTNLPVTLNVTGANTFTDVQTVATLAAGATTTVTFANYPTTMTVGTNTVTVSVPADGNNTNLAISQQQLISATTQSYIAPDQTTTATGGVGFGTGAGILASKFTLSAVRTVNSVSVVLSGDPAAVGRTVYGVVLSAAGAILGRSADYVITTADLGTNKLFTITAPPSVPAGDFYAGLAQVAFTTAYYPLGTQSELPTRPGAFYIAALAGGTPSDVASQGFGRFMIEATVSTTTATSPELMRATSVYPNPSATGVFNLAINGANAKQGLEVEVTNTLGQRVYAGTVRDNFTTQLDLSNLAAGLYHLKVKNGDEYMLRQISIAK